MISENKLYWTAFYTKPRNEKKVAERLAAKGFEIYCPTRSVLKKWSDRKKKVVEPVFSSYIFARVCESQRLEILHDVGIVSNVRWLGQPALIRDNEIAEIRSFLDDYNGLSISTVNLNVGDRIEVDGGALTGRAGTIRRKKGNRVILSIISLGIEMMAEVPISHLKQA